MLGRCAFIGLYGFPKHICISVNDEVVHGIPSERRVLAEGDVVGLDFGVVYRGFYGDSAVTVPIGTVSADTLKLLRVTQESLGFLCRSGGCGRGSRRGGLRVSGGERGRGIEEGPECNSGPTGGIA